MAGECPAWRATSTTDAPSARRSEQKRWRRWYDLEPSSPASGRSRTHRVLDTGSGLENHLPHERNALCLHGRDALDLVAERELLVGADVDLDQRELARSRLGLALEHGAEHAAGPAPGGPEVDHDRQLVGAFEHLALEALACHVHIIVSPFSAAAVSDRPCSGEAACREGRSRPRSSRA